MSLQDLLLIFTAGITFAVGLLIGIRDRHNTANRMYFLTTICMSAWALSLLIFRIYSGDEVLDFFGKMSYVTGLLMVIFFYFFARYFPYAKRSINKVTRDIFIVISIIATFTMLQTDLLVSSVVVADGVVSMVTNPVSHSLYALAWLVLFFLSMTNLSKKMHESGGGHRKQISIIFYMTLIAGLFGVVFDIILPLFGDYKWNWLGPQFLILMTIAVGMIIFSPKFTGHD